MKMIVKLYFQRLKIIDFFYCLIVSDKLKPKIQVLSLEN